MKSALFFVIAVIPFSGIYAQMPLSGSQASASSESSAIGQSIQLDSSADEKSLLKSQLIEAQKRNTNLTEQLASAKKLQDTLSQSIQAIQKPATVSPPDIVVVDRDISDMSAIILVRTSLGTAVSAKIYEDNSQIPYATIDAKYPDDLKNDHLLRFEGLAQKRTYKVRLKVVNINGALLLSPAIMGSSKLDFVTAEPLAAPSISLKAPKSGDTTSNSATVRFTVNKPSYVELSCRQHIKGEAGPRNCESGVKVTTNLLGVPTGPKKYDPDVEYTITVNNLQANSEYELMPVAYDEHGKQSQALPATTPTYETLKAKDPFAFLDAVEMKLSAAAISLKWTASEKPVSASASVQVSANSFLTNGEATISEQDGRGIVQLDIPQPQGDLIKALQDRLDNRKDKPVPTIKISMKNSDGIEIYRKFSIGMAIPDASNPSLTSDQKAAVQKLNQAVQQGATSSTKFSWKELVQLGLPTLLTFL